MNAPIETAPLPATERAARQPQAVAALAPLLSVGPSRSSRN
jgi:hypothetical protein